MISGKRAIEPRTATTTWSAALMMRPDLSRLRGRRDVALIALLLD